MSYEEVAKILIINDYGAAIMRSMNGMRDSNLNQQRWHQCKEKGTRKIARSYVCYQFLAGRLGLEPLQQG